MPIDFPIIPQIPTLPSPGTVVSQAVSQVTSAIGGLPPLATFPGSAQIVGSIQGTVLSVTSGAGALAQGLSLQGLGVNPATVLTSGITDITNGVATATVNIAQNISSQVMTVTGSLSNLLPDFSSLLGGDSIDAVVGAGSTVKWGIFLDGSLAIDPDSFFTLEYKRDYQTVDYPIEQGSFQSYNKVTLPYEVKATITKGGVEADLASFLRTAEDIVASLNLYTIVTPEKTYENANATHMDYSRAAANGVSLLAIHIWFQEIRVEASSTFTNTANASDENQQNSGVVQTSDATQQEQQTYTDWSADNAT